MKCFAPAHVIDGLVHRLDASGRQGFGHVADSQSDEKVNPGFQKGIRIGSAKDGIVKIFIPVPGPGEKTTITTEGVAADARGNLYRAEANSNNLRKYSR